MSTFAYELYKRNVAYLQIGVKDKEDDTLIKLKNGKFTAKPSRTENERTIFCYYKEMPKFKFASGFAKDDSALLGYASKLKNYWEGLKKGIDGAQENWDSTLAGIPEAFKEGVMAMLKGDIPQTAAPSLQRWRGQEPISFTIDLIFMDPQGGPVFFDDKIRLLLSLVTFSTPASLLGEDWLMNGPIGYNGTALGVASFGDFLKGETNHGLHSLILYKGSMEESKEGNRTHGENIVKVLDLWRILVVTNVDLKMSEQLYIGSSEEKGPAFKWITATVNFSTACPLPNPFIGAEYANVANFYGLEK